MKSININQLQDQASKTIRDLEKEGVVEVIRYSKPVAYLISEEEYQRLKSGEDCKKCVTELRQLVKRK